MQFEELGVSAGLAEKLARHGFKEAFEVQERTIPLALQKKNLAIRAKTGSGKTLAFGIPLAEQLRKGGGLQAMVLTPTRELALQIDGVFRKLGLRTALIYGGVGYDRQIRDLHRAEVVVGTPGRILDHIARGNLRARFQVTVLDEADRMLDMGFLPDVSRIMRECPSELVWLFSATLDRRILKVFKDKRFETVLVGEEMPEIEHFYIDTEQKMKVLRKVLNGEKALIFCNTKRMVQRVGDWLRIPALHGDMSQAARERNLHKFRNGARYLVATDVAARGLDIPEVEIVVNFDIPKDSQTYVHRVGRTGRAGKRGRVVNLLKSRDHDDFRRILNDLDLEIERLS